MRGPCQGRCSDGSDRAQVLEKSRKIGLRKTKSLIVWLGDVWLPGEGNPAKVLEA